MRLRSRRLSKGFTLLEVLLATAIMAVGTTSVLVVIATAAGMASQRQVGLRRAQVLDEAMHDAKAMVDSFHPSAAAPAAAAKPAAGAKKDPKAASAGPKLAPDDVLNKPSTRYGGFSYDIKFRPKDRLVLEKGYDVDVVLHYGGGDLSYSASASMLPAVVSSQEFERSATFLEEQEASTKSKPKETR